jgi:alpha-galactosidase
MYVMGNFAGDGFKTAGLIEDQIDFMPFPTIDPEVPLAEEAPADAFSGILSAYAIEYVKWDHNRVLPMPDANQTRGTYALLDRLREAHPNAKIESCASGGGRIDFGILSRTHRVWLSDSNDALERLRIQHNAAIFLPMAFTGSHVGPRKCHTSGRVLDTRFRAWVAAQRHMEFEMDPLGFLEDRVGADAGRQTAFARQGDPDFQAFHHDLYRAVGEGRWWIMEQQPGPAN